MRPLELRVTPELIEDSAGFEAIRSVILNDVFRSMHTQFLAALFDGVTAEELARMEQNARN